MRAAFRNEVRAPSSACTRSSSGVQRAVNSAQTGETLTFPVGVVRRRAGYQGDDFFRYCPR